MVGSMSNQRAYKDMNIVNIKNSMSNQMKLSKILGNISKEVGFTIYRKINYKIVDGKKKPVPGDRSNFTPDQIKADPGKWIKEEGIFNCWSIYLNYIPNLFVVDIDCNEEQMDYLRKDGEIMGFLESKNCWKVPGNTKGFHYYVFVTGAEQIRGGTKVYYNKEYEIDLMKHQSNVWEKKGKFVEGERITIDWNEPVTEGFKFSDYFSFAKKKPTAKKRTEKVEKVVKRRGQLPPGQLPPVKVVIANQIPPTIEEVQKLLDRLESCRAVPNQSWVAIGYALCNIFEGKPTGRKLWDAWSKANSGDNYDPDELEEKWDNMRFNKDSDRTHYNIGSLINWANEDNPLNVYQEAYNTGGINAVVQEANKYLIWVVKSSDIILLDDEDPNMWWRKSKKQAEDEFLNRKFFGKGVKKPTRVFDVWIGHTNRRSVKDIVFNPKVLDDGKNFNMFKGYAIKYKDCKDEHLEDAQPWVDHIKNIICKGDEKLFKWTMSWLALTIQKPWIKAGVMLMIKSNQGAGKQRMFNPLLEIIGEANSLEVNNMDMLTSRFNSHLAGKVLIVIDEALFGGNIKQRSQLKNLITSYIQNIEMKGKDMISIKDFCNLASLTNNSFSAPVDENQRRFMYWQCLMNGLPAQKHTLKRKRERITKQSPAQMNHTLEL